MATITEDYVSLEVAKLLKDKGFDVDECEVHYDPLDHTQHEITLQMAMKWLREVHKIYIDINIHIILEQWAGYDINIYATNTKDCLLDKVISYKGSKYTSYEQACEAAIKYCLENLI